MLRLARAWARVAVHLVPARCFACDERLPVAQHLGACARCWAGLAPLLGPTCRHCGVSVPAGDRCAPCAARPIPLEGTVAAFVYDVHARRFLLRAKAGGRRELLPQFGRQLAAAVRVSGLHDRIDAVVSVAATPLSRILRGYDPAREIGREAARVLKVPFDDGRLRRRTFAFRQAKGLGAAERWRMLHDAFVDPRGGARRILLVDDVMTSGATASACASALRAAGAATVHAAVWARTPRRDAFDRIADRLL